MQTKRHRTKRNAEKMSQDKTQCRQNVTGQNAMQTKCHRTKRNADYVYILDFFFHFIFIMLFFIIDIIDSYFLVSLKKKEWGGRSILAKSAIDIVYPKMIRHSRKRKKENHHVVKKTQIPTIINAIDVKNCRQ